MFHVSSSEFDWFIGLRSRSLIHVEVQVLCRLSKELHYVDPAPKQSRFLFRRLRGQGSGQHRGALSPRPHEAVIKYRPGLQSRLGSQRGRTRFCGQDLVPCCRAKDFHCVVSVTRDHSQSLTQHRRLGFPRQEETERNSSKASIKI